MAGETKPFELVLMVYTPDDKKLGVKHLVDPANFFRPRQLEMALDWTIDHLKGQTLKALRESGYFDGRP